jgi:hypothetical protein
MAYAVAYWLGTKSLSRKVYQIIRLYSMCVNRGIEEEVFGDKRWLSLIYDKGFDIRGVDVTWAFLCG